MVSRESAFLLNNIVLVSALFTIFLGTIFPLLSEAVAGVQVSVGAPYFNSVTVPLFLFLVFLMGVGPMIAWRRASWDNLKRNFLWPAAASLMLAVWLCSSGRCGSFCRCSVSPCSPSWSSTIVYDTALALRARKRIAGEGIAARSGHAGAAQSAALRRLRRSPRRRADHDGHRRLDDLQPGARSDHGTQAGLTSATTESSSKDSKARSSRPTFASKARFRVFHNGRDEGILTPGAEIFSDPAVAGRPRRASEQPERRYLFDSLRLQRSRTAIKRRSKCSSARW